MHHVMQNTSLDVVIVPESHRHNWTANGYHCFFSGIRDACVTFVSARNIFGDTCVALEGEQWFGQGEDIKREFVVRKTNRPTGHN